MNRAHPLILTLDQHGVPHRWVTWQQAVWYYAKERVAWETGREAFTIWGGRSHLTGERSSHHGQLHHRHPRQGAGDQGLPLRPRR